MRECAYVDSTPDYADFYDYADSNGFRGLIAYVTPKKPVQS